MNHNFLFGYGSIINNTSRAATSGAVPEVAVIAKLLHPSFVRSWSFRSHTGFTALGLIRSENDLKEAICGVLVPVSLSSLAQFDIREVGYNRIEIDPKLIHICDGYGDIASREKVDCYRTLLADGAKVWVFIPEDSRALPPDKDHPILQSYVDVCVRGCLEWGGEAFARQFLLSTEGWSDYYLDDTPNSRRPWIHRRDHLIIDGVLAGVAEHIRYKERRHPEEYSSAHLHNFTGIWGVPSRHACYTGREAELRQLHDLLLTWNSCQVVGMGGVGKTSLVGEYCHRQFGDGVFSLIIWLRAESAASIAADMRRFGVDVGILNQSFEETDDDATVLKSVHRSLLKCRSNYLFVFDNVSDFDMVRSFLPRGQQMHTDGTVASSGLVHFVTTSRGLDDSMGVHRALQLNCFDPEESANFLRESLHGGIRGDGLNSETDLRDLAAALGHLPLALSMAAAYFSSCDVTAREYLRRLSLTSCSRGRHLAAPGLADVEVVSASLNLTLRSIEKELPEAIHLMTALAFLDSDSITRPLIQKLLVVRQPETVSVSSKTLFQSHPRIAYYVAYTCFAITVASPFLLLRLLTLLVGLRALSHVEHKLLMVRVDAPEARKSGSPQSAEHFLSIDKVWEVLKRYSLLQSSVGADANIYGSIHRLQTAAIRMNLTPKESLDALKRIIGILVESWTYSPVEGSTWTETGEILKHITRVAEYVTDLIPFLRLDSTLLIAITPQAMHKLSSLLTDGASYLAFALSRFDSARLLLEKSLFILDFLGAAATIDVKEDVARSTHDFGIVAYPFLSFFLHNNLILFRKAVAVYWGVYSFERLVAGSVADA